MAVLYNTGFNINIVFCDNTNQYSIGDFNIALCNSLGTIAVVMLEVISSWNFNINRPKIQLSVEIGGKPLSNQTMKVTKLCLLFGLGVTWVLEEPFNWTRPPSRGKKWGWVVYSTI